MIAPFVRVASNLGVLVLDPFLGSGTAVWPEGASAETTSTSSATEGYLEMAGCRLAAT